MSSSKYSVPFAVTVEKAVEWLRKERDSNKDVFLINTADLNVYCLVTLDWSLNRPCGSSEFIEDTTFRRQVVFSRSSSGKMVITADVTVKWNDGGREHATQSSTKFTDWADRW